jgi:hypothetical protein
MLTAEAGPASPLFSAAPVPATLTIDASAANEVAEKQQVINKARKMRFMKSISDVSINNAKTRAAWWSQKSRSIPIAGPIVPLYQNYNGMANYFECDPTGFVFESPRISLARI